MSQGVPRCSQRSYWAKTGVIPAKWWANLLQLARERGVALEPDDFVSSKQFPVAGQNTSSDNRLVAVMPSKVAAPAVQGRLDLGIDRQVEIDGVGMGVLSDGTPFAIQPRAPNPSLSDWLAAVILTVRPPLTSPPSAQTTAASSRAAGRLGAAGCRPTC